MSVDELRGLITVFAMAAFLGVCWWAYRGSNRGRFEEDARIPFLEDAAVNGDAREDAMDSDAGRGTDR